MEGFNRHVDQYHSSDPRLRSEALAKIRQHNDLEETLRAWCAPAGHQSASPPLSFRDVVKLVAKDPDLGEPLRMYLSGELFAAKPSEDRLRIRERLAWAVVEALQNELEQTYRILGVVASAPEK